ncbi:MAG: hypothetical protein ACR2NQ_05795 [Thermodesulfobacteriota bacterium]
MHRATKDLWDCLAKFPKSVQESAKKSLDLLNENPKYPSLRFKKVGGLWSIRLSGGYRALAVECNGVFIWFWAGNHDEYEKTIKKH